MTKNRYVWLDILKIIACFFVIINHSHNLLFSATSTSTSSVLFDSVFFAICKSAVPLFVMTSGFLLLKKEVPFKKTCQRIFRIIVPLIVFSVLCFWMAQTEPRTVSNFLSIAIKEPISTYLWYLYMLPGLYLAVPYIAKIVNNSTIPELGLFVGISLFIPSLSSLITTYTGCEFSANWFFGFFPPVLGYLVAGVLLTRIPLSRNYFWASVILYTVSILGFVASALLPYINSGTFGYRLDSWQSFPIAVSSLSLYYIIRYLFEGKEINKISKLISEISMTTFGIYLFHILALNKISYHPITQAILGINAYVGVAFVQISCFIGCAIVVFILKKIPIIKSFL